MDSEARMVVSIVVAICFVLVGMVSCTAYDRYAINAKNIAINRDDNAAIIELIEQGQSIAAANCAIKNDEESCIAAILGK